VQNSLCVQVLRSPILAALLHSIPAASVSQTSRRGTKNGITELSQRALPIYSIRLWRPSRWASAHIQVPLFTPVFHHHHSRFPISSLSWSHPFPHFEATTFISLLNSVLPLLHWFQITEYIEYKLFSSCHLHKVFRATQSSCVLNLILPVSLRQPYHSLFLTHLHVCLSHRLPMLIHHFHHP